MRRPNRRLYEARELILQAMELLPGRTWEHARSQLDNVADSLYYMLDAVGDDPMDLFTDTHASNQGKHERPMRLMQARHTVLGQRLIATGRHRTVSPSHESGSPGIERPDQAPKATEGPSVASPRQEDS